MWETDDLAEHLDNCDEVLLPARSTATVNIMQPPGGLQPYKRTAATYAMCLPCS